MTTQPIAVPSRSTRVKIQRHEPDFGDHLSDPVLDRLINLADPSPAFLYVNPMVTITCESETREFYQAVQKYRGQWCSRVKKTLGPRACRGVRGWAPRRPNMSRRDRYLDYALSVTGVMFINGQQMLKSPGKLSIADACETFLNPPPAKKTRRILGGKASPADRRRVNRHLAQLLGNLAALVQHLDDLEQRAEQLDEANGDARKAGRSNRFFTPQFKRLATEAWDETFTAMVQAAEQVGLSPQPSALSIR